ncbi:ABC transporter substrate-binding protein [Pseudomonas sichuanensis]|uniref:siderophore ABC transporter substrate-binding protein n=1 Tax=Pseudomonas sichuanensis TaxID=2213015 RepID=UPI00244C0648|nr:ABC transporter substrate-binding protein [Pseudomonas sichuanensis]MDH0730162.1 ABC transporter substrate-binding protein [Pseudomonas sichuanensis]MDH1581254.1 ABC transporter substrate-binding protein [Pseudomonas sichuanensis]MDH1593415.1 ABC transporter substrate-binding protein [Pseudomonas sichuanensis]MDH1597170.1 ABC transporter substrate-binding protein [Pseudomonas sichuanensis]
MTKRIFLSILLGLALSCSSGLVYANINPIHQGIIHVPVRPSSVLVFDPGSLDTLSELGIEPGGVPVDHWAGALRKYADSRFLKVGSLFDPNFEAVYRAHPDLILIADRSRSHLKQLSEIAPTLDLTVDDRNILIESERNALKLGELFGRVSTAVEKINNLEHSIKSLKALASRQGRGLILLTSGGRMSAYGPGSRFGILHDTFGIRPVDPNLEVAVHGQPVSYEYLSKMQPDWLFVIDRDSAIGEDGAAASRLLDNALVHQTPAWKRNQIIYLDTDDWYMIGLTGLGSLQRTVDSLILRLSGDSSDCAAEGYNCEVVK